MYSEGGVVQVVVAVMVNLLSFSIGTNMGWASSGMMFLESNETTLTTGPLTPQESGLINSMYCVGGLIGSSCYGFICDKIGRKRALQTTAIPQIISYLLIAYSTTEVMIFVSRFFAGLSAGSLYICIPLFISEIAEDMIRGALGTLFLLMAGFGLLLGYILGAYMDYNTCVYVYMLLPLLFLICSEYIRETPFYLIQKQKIKEAEDSIMFYRGVKTLESNAGVELKLMVRFVKAGMASEEKVQFRDFLTKAARKSIIIGMVLVALEQFSGAFALLFYVASVFESSGADFLSPEVSTIFVGVIQVLGAYLATFLVDRAGRRVLLSTSAFGLAFGMTVFGAAVQLIEHGHGSPFIKLIPVFALSFSIFLANIGVFTLTFVILSEITPANVKSHIFTMCMMFSWIWTFTIFNLLSPLVDLVGQGGAMYYFAINSFLGGIFTLLYIPETKGKSFDEIMAVMES